MIGEKVPVNEGIRKTSLINGSLQKYCKLKRNEDFSRQLLYCRNKMKMKEKNMRFSKQLYMKEKGR